MRRSRFMPALSVALTLCITVQVGFLAGRAASDTPPASDTITTPAGEFYTADPTSKPAKQAETVAPASTAAPISTPVSTTVTSSTDKDGVHTRIILPKNGKALQWTLTKDTLVMTDDVSEAEAQVQAYPEDPEAYFLLAMAYSRTPYFEKAFAAAKKAKQIMKESPDGYARLDSKIAEYQAGVKAAGKSGPEAAKLHYRLAFADFMKGYAIEKHYIKNSSDTATQWYSKSEAELRQVIAMDPKDIWARNYLGYTLIEIDKEANLDKAIALWEESIRINDNNPGAYMMLGQAYLKKGDLQKGLTYSARGLAARTTWAGQ